MGIYIKRSGSYPAIIRRCGKAFEARFVDLPHCVARGSSAIEAEESARAALAAYADVARQGAREIPPPSSGRHLSDAPDEYTAYIKLRMVDEALSTSGDDNYLGDNNPLKTFDYLSANIVDPSRFYPG